MNNEKKSKDIMKEPFKNLSYEERVERLKKSGNGFVQKLYKYSGNLDNLEDIIKKYSWKMFNFIFTGKKGAFVEYLERICASNQIKCGFDIDGILSATTREEFRENALAFMCGFLSEKKSREEGGKNGRE